MHEHEHPPESEPKLTFPARDRELDIFFGDRLIGDAAGDGGEFIRQYDPGTVARLFDIARDTKAHLARRLGLDADGRRWITLQRPNLRAVRNDHTTFKDGTPRNKALAQLTRVVSDIVERWYDAATLRDGGYQGPYTKEQHMLLRDFGHPYDRTFLGQSLAALKDTLMYPPNADDDAADRLALLSMLPADDAGKRSLRTAKVLSKYYDAERLGLGDISINTLLARICDALAQQRSHLCISVNPLDFLLSATRGACDFSSCHSLDGCHSVGNSAYVRDPQTVLVFSVSPDRTEFPFFKTGRAWLYIGEDDQICMGRLYGRGLSPIYVNYIVRQVELLLRPEGGLWRVANNVHIDFDRIENIGHTENNHWPYAGYHDDHYARVAMPKSHLASLSSPSTLSPDEEDDDAVPRVSTALPYFEFFPGLCLACGCDVGYEEKPHQQGMCKPCAQMWTCKGCSERTNSNRYYVPDVGDMCYDCYRGNYAECNRCSSVVTQDRTQSVATVLTRWGEYRIEHQTWCDTCRGNTDNEIVHCESCDESVAHPSHSPVTLDDGTVLCAMHAATETTRCNECDSRTWNGYDECPCCANDDDDTPAEPAASEATNA